MIYPMLDGALNVMDSNKVNLWNSRQLIDRMMCPYSAEATDEWTRFVELTRSMIRLLD